MPLNGQLPSQRWHSFDGWNFNGMKERLESRLTEINRQVLIEHSEKIKGQKVFMSQPFSAGQYWVCFELVAQDGDVVIARVRLPRHPDTPLHVTENDETYSIACEIETMRFIREKLPGLPLPEVYAYESMDSDWSKRAGATYMLLEGFRGNSIQDLAFDLCQLPEAAQRHIITQWTAVQTSLATLAYPQIGSICGISDNGEPIIGKLMKSLTSGELRNAGPFSTTKAYFTEVADTACARLQGASKTAALVFRDIIMNTSLFDDLTPGQFPLNHMDMGTQNILVDDDFNFLAIIDWEFLQTAPWQVNHYPMPFPLGDTDVADILGNSDHLAYKAVLLQQTARDLYRSQFDAAEKTIMAEGDTLGAKFSEVLESPASRIYSCFTHLGRQSDYDETSANFMARSAFGFDEAAAHKYIIQIESEAA